MKNEENFIQKLSKMSLEEINQLILERGKPKKVIPGIIYDDLDSKKILIGQYNK